MMMQRYESEALIFSSSRISVIIFQKITLINESSFICREREARIIVHRKPTFKGLVTTSHSFLRMKCK